MSHFDLSPRGPYALAASMRFLEGFTPAAYESRTADALRLAFITDSAFVEDGQEQTAGVVVRTEGDRVVGEVTGDADPEAVREQVARILSLDVDGRAFPAVGTRDPVVGRLQARYPGLRPVLFFSPYEAAAWALIGNRIRITQAARIKARMTEELGTAVTLGGAAEYAFPGPSRLRQLEHFPGLSDRKVSYLRALADAAGHGQLDATFLRSLPASDALAMLQEMLPGIGPFGAELILLRGVGVPDQLPVREPRLGRAVALAYGLAQPPAPDELATIAEAWHPYRTWVALLLRTFLEDETHEIRGRPAS